MYTKLNLTNGDVLSDMHLNHIEEGITNIEQDVNEFKKKVSQIVSSKGIPTQETESLNDIVYKINQLSNNVSHEYDCGDLIDIRETIESGTIKMVCTDRGDGRVGFTVWTKDNSQYVVDWGNGEVTRHNSGSGVTKYYRKGGGQPYEEGVTQYVCTISSENGNQIKRFQITGGGTIHQIEWFASKDIYFTNVDGMFCPNISNVNTRCEYLKYVDIIGGALTSTESIYARSLFYGAYGLKRINATINLSGATEASRTFCNCKELTEAPFVNTTGVVDLSYFYDSCNKLEVVPNINTSSATTVAYMYAYCYALHTFPLELDLRSCTNAQSMFLLTKGAEVLPELKNTGKIVNALSMFDTSGVRTMQPILDLSSATNTQSLFINCPSLTDAPTELYLDSTQNVRWLFSGCKNLRTAPTTINAPMATDAYEMFFNCASLRKAPSLINMPRAINPYNMFRGCSSMTTSPTEIILTDAKEVYSMFEGCSLLETAPERIDCPNATNANNLFYNCYNLKQTPVEINLPSALYVNSLFSGCSSLVNIRFDELSLPMAIETKYLFSRCGALVTAPRLNLPSTTNVAGMFESCSQLKNVPSYSFPQAKDLGYFFRYCSTIETIGEIDAPVSTSWSEFYRDCTSLREVASIGSPMATNMNYLFYATRKIERLPEVIEYSSVTAQTAADFNQLRNVIGEVAIRGLRTSFDLYSNPNLTAIRLLEPSQSIENLNFSNNGMNAEAINQLFRDLPQVNTRRTINVSGNVGASTCDPTIATAKNWNVTR